MQASIYKIKPFDAEIGTTITFSWTGNQVFGNRCIILDNETNEEVYNYYIDSHKLEHTLDLSQISEGKLINGKIYIAYITVYDKDGNESDRQTMGQIFLCLKTPIYNFTNIIEGQILDSSSYGFQLEYAQENGELLDSWQITVYDMTNKVLSSSGVKYDTDNLFYVFSGFTNKSQYKIRAIGETVNGMYLDTGYITFSVSYEKAAVFSMIDLTNLPRQGAILLHSNIISADGKAEKEPVTFIENEYVDLTNNSVVYDEGFLFEGNFSIVLYAYHITPNVPFFKFYSGDNDEFEGTITYRVGNIGTTDWVGYLELNVKDGILNYVVNSNKISAIDANTMLGFCLTRENGIYDLQIENLGTVNPDTNEVTQVYIENTEGGN